MLCLLHTESKKRQRKKKKEKQPGDFFSQGWTYLAGCAVQDF
jgi:hypothetical protein